MRKDYSVTLLCFVLKVSKSGYYAYLKRPKKVYSKEEKAQLKAIKKVFKRHSGTYGAKRIAKYLKKKKGIVINHKKVARLMREANLQVTIRRPKTTKESKEQNAGFIYENKLNRKFDASHPNQKWVTDMTELKIINTKFYISAILDLFNREIIGFVISTSPNKELIEETIRAAMKKRKLKNLEDVVIHSDQGSVYRSHHYHQLSKDLGFIPSMSRKGNCWDNAVIESFFSHLKTEFPCFYPINTVESFPKNMKNFISYFNENRIQDKLGSVSPKEYYLNYKRAV